MLLNGCVSSKGVQSKYFEMFQQKQISAGHYGNYYILDGSKRVFKMNLSEGYEIMVESDSKSGAIIYFSDDFLKDNLVFLFEDEMYKVSEGKFVLYQKKNKIDVSIDVIGVKEIEGTVNDTVPIIEQKTQKIIFKGKIKEKEI